MNGGASARRKRRVSSANTVDETGRSVGRMVARLLNCGHVPPWSGSMLRRIALGLASVVVIVGSAGRVDAGEKRLAVNQVQYDEQRGVAYSLAHTSDGGVRLTGRMSELVFEKTSYADGHFALQLTSGDDVVVFKVGSAGTEVSRGGRIVKLADAATDREADEVRALLAGSRAVRRYRLLAAALEQSDENSPAAHGVLIAAVVVHGLDGDPGAAPRIARRLATPHAPERLWKIAFTQASIDCWVEYAAHVTTAYNDFQICLLSATWYTYQLVSYSCSGLWLIRVEGYWFQYLRCSAFF
jgi:hypothetical protein